MRTSVHVCQTRGSGFTEAIGIRSRRASDLLCFTGYSIVSIHCRRAQAEMLSSFYHSFWPQTDNIGAFCSSIQNSPRQTGRMRKNRQTCVPVGEGRRPLFFKVVGIGCLQLPFPPKWRTSAISVHRVWMCRYITTQKERTLAILCQPAGTSATFGFWIGWSGLDVCQYVDLITYT